MNTQELKERYKHLYDAMKQSKSVENMQVFGRADNYFFDWHAENNPSMAKKWLEMLEPVVWNNYLTADQAQELAAQIVNQDGTKGPHWSMETFFSVVPKLGGSIEDEPYYNRYALWLVANAHYSDFAKSTSEDMGYQTVDEVPPEKMALSMYKKAVESLKDVDRPHYIQNYYHV